MFKLLGKLSNKKYYVAFSGGKDSVAFTHYLLSKGYEIILLHFHHNLSKEDENSYNFTKSFAKEYGLELIVDILNKPKVKGESPESFQRKHRYVFLEKFNDSPVLMLHNLSDNVETWLFGSIHGQPKLIPYQNKNIIRPFMLNSSDDVLQYLKRNELSWYEDLTNNDKTIPRNKIRHDLVKEVLVVNSGFFSLISKKIKAKYQRDFNDSNLLHK